LERGSTEDSRYIDYVASVRGAGSPIGVPVVGILVAEKYTKSLIVLTVIETVRPGVVPKHAEVLLEPLLQGNITGVVCPAATIIELLEVRIIPSASRIHQEENTTLVGICS